MTKQIDPERRFYLRERRNAAGLTQEQLAELIGTSKGMVSQMETGSHRYNEGWVTKIAAVLGLEPADLLTPPDALPVSIRSDPVLAKIIDAWPHMPAGRRETLVQLANTFADRDQRHD